MRKINNIFVDLPEYRCFGCSPHNHHGLHLEFFSDDEKNEVFSVVEQTDDFHGFPGLLHGGIASTLMDEIGFWILFDRLGKFGLTVNMNIDYIKAIQLPQRLEVRASVISSKKRSAMVACRVIDSQGDICAEGTLKFVLASKKMWQKISGKENLPEFLAPYIT